MLLTTVCLGLPGAAVAQQPPAFGAPQTILPAGSLGFYPRFVPLPGDAAGRSLVVAPRGFQGEAALLTVGRNRPGSVVETTGVVAGPVVTGRANALVAFRERDDTIVVRRFRTSGRAEFRLSTRRNVVFRAKNSRAGFAIEPVVLAGDGAGRGVLAAIRRTGRSGDRAREVVASVRRSGRFGPPFRVAVGRINKVEAAYGARGELLIVWQAAGTGSSEGTVFAQLRRPGRKPGAAVVLGPGHNGSALRAAFAADGRAYVAWQSENSFSEGGGQIGGRVSVATARPGASRIGRPTTLDATTSSGYYVGGRLSLDVGPAGAVVGWSQRPQPDPGERTDPTQGTTDLVGTAVVAAASPGGRFGSPATISEGPYEALEDVALSPAGEVSALYGDARVATRPAAGARFGAAQVLGGEGSPSQLGGDLVYGSDGALSALYTKGSNSAAQLLLARRNP